MTTAGVICANRRTKRETGSLVGAPYVWYTALDKSIVPPHAGTGAWGSQYTIQEAAPPVPLTSVTVFTWSEFQTQVLLGARTITLGADINGSMGFINGGANDIDIIVPPGRILRSFVFGAFQQGHVYNRLRIRGNTVGVRSGGQIHNIQWLAQTNDTIIDGLDVTGPGVVGVEQQSALLPNNGGSRFAITNCRGAAGCYFYIGAINDLIVTGCSIHSSLQARQGGGFEGWVFRLSGGVGTHVFYANDLRANRYNVLRFHPDSTATYTYVSNNWIANLHEGQLAQVNQLMVTTPKGYYRGYWVDSNTLWTDIDLAPGDINSPHFLSNSSAYVRFTNNTVRSDELTSDASLGILDVYDAAASNITGATQANPVVITTSAAHGFDNGLSVHITSVGGMTQLNDQWFTVAGATSTTFQLSGVNGTAYGAYTSGGKVLDALPIPSGVEDWVKSGNTYSAFTSPVGWKSTTPGDPTGLTWNLGA